MKRKDFQTELEMVIRSASREQGDMKAVKVLEKLPQVVMSVRIDRDELLKCVEQECSGNGSNPIGALLKLLGLNVTKRTVEGIGEEIDLLKADNSNQSNLRSFLTMDRKEMESGIAEVVEAIIRERTAAENKFESSKTEEEKLKAQLEASAEQLRDAQVETEDIRRTVAESAQFMYSSKNAAENPLIEKIEELLHDLDMEICTEAKEGTPSDTAMFTVLKCDDPSIRSIHFSRPTDRRRS